MSPCGWRPERTQGIWHHGPAWLRPLSSISPWFTAALALATMYVVGQTFTASRGTLFDLAETDISDGVRTSVVAIILPRENETTVIFDDAYYSLEVAASADALGEQIAERMSRSTQKSILVLVDRRIPWDDLSRFSAIARAHHVEKVLFANKRAEVDSE